MRKRSMIPCARSHQRLVSPTTGRPVVSTTHSSTWNTTTRHTHAARITSGHASRSGFVTVADGGTRVEVM